MILVNYNSFDPIFVFWLSVSSVTHILLSKVTDLIWVNGFTVTY